MLQELNTLVAKYNPSPEFVDGLRALNIIVGFVACLVLLVVLARPRWHAWNVPTRLGWMALFMLCISGTYASFEVRYLDTYFRVPMVTVALIWAIIAALWPHDVDHPRSRKK